MTRLNSRSKEDGPNQKHIQVGRSNEIKSLINDIDRINEGGSGARFVVGDYGSGKTFFIQVVRNIALEKNLVTANADLNPQRRLNASGGEARSLYTELMRNVATRTRPDGGALQSVVEKFISSALSESKRDGSNPETVIHSKLEKLMEMVNGYDFANVIASYWKGHDIGNEQLKMDSVRWLRGEFTTKTDARSALGVRTIVDDANVYDMLKLMSQFVRLSGYAGLFVGLDEMVNLYKIGNSKSRIANYEQILRYLNDSLQGTSSGLLFVFAFTPESLMDTRRGLYSYEALQSRLSENTFSQSVGVTDYTSPVLRLANLTPEDLYILMSRIRQVFMSNNTGLDVPDEALKQFMLHCSKRIGDAYFRTPRNTVRAFVDFLFVLDQNTELRWEDLVGGITIQSEQPEENELKNVNSESPEDELVDFKL